jgi:hypothetical protein
MKVAICIPCHIYYEDQFNLLQKCLQSIRNQSYKCNAYVSISFQNSKYASDARMTQIIRENYKFVTFILSEKQKFQLEHLYQIHKLVQEYDMLMFCDDDDTYKETRVETFVKHFKYLQEQCIKQRKQNGGVREMIRKYKDEYDYTKTPEYWAYGIPPKILTAFFQKSEGYEELFKDHYADMYLRSYLATNGGEDTLSIGITDYLYLYNIANPFSITRRAQKVTIIKTKEEYQLKVQNIKLLFQGGYTDRLIKEKMKNYKITDKIMYKYCRDIKKIKEFQKKLRS